MTSGSRHNERKPGKKKTSGATSAVSSVPWPWPLPVVPVPFSPSSTTTSGSLRRCCDFCASPPRSSDRGFPGAVTLPKPSNAGLKAASFTPVRSFSLSPSVPATPTSLLQRHNVHGRIHHHRRRHSDGNVATTDWNHRLRRSSTGKRFPAALLRLVWIPIRVSFRPSSPCQFHIESTLAFELRSHLPQNSISDCARDLALFEILCLIPDFLTSNILALPCV